MDVHQVIRSIGGILDNIPFDRPELRARFIIETNELNGIPYHIRRYFDICFIYRDDVDFDACCILQRTVSTYTIIIIIKRVFETDFQQQEANKDFLSRDYKSVCRRRELYCHEVCHLVAIIRAFPSYKDESTQKNFFLGIFPTYNTRAKVESLEKKFYQKTTMSFKYVLTGLKTMLVYNIPLSFNDFEESPSEFDRAHFPYEGDKLNYFKLFSEFMVSDRKLKKFIGKIPEYIRGKKIEAANNQYNWERCFRDLLHVEIFYIMRKAPEKRRIIIEEIQRMRNPFPF
jgi:hypothetical protein